MAGPSQHTRTMINFKTSQGDEGEVVVELTGPLDEFADLGPVFSLPGRKLHLNLERVERVNSMGVRNWVRALDQHLQGREIVFEKVKPPILEQFNLIRRFGGGGRILSLYIPYLCEPCGQETLALKSADECRRGDHWACPVTKCPSCRAAMVLDDDEKEFFLYFYGPGTP